MTISPAQGTDLNADKTPMVSVVIPAYRHCNHILQTIDSVLAQTFSDYEIIVINDGSPDQTAEVLQPLADAGRIHYYYQKNSGVADTRNRGLALARGEFIAFLDDDDLWPPEKLAWQVEWLQRHPESPAVFGDHVEFHMKHAGLDAVAIMQKTSVADSETAGHASVTFESLFEGCPFGSPGQGLIRTEFVRRLGGFRGQFWGTDDYDLWLRIARVHAFDRVFRTALLYRKHPLAASSNRGRMLRNCSAVLQEALSGLPRSRRRKLYYRGQGFLFRYGILGLVLNFVSNITGGRVAPALRSLGLILYNLIRHPYLAWLMVDFIFSKNGLRSWVEKLRQKQAA